MRRLLVLVGSVAMAACSGKDESPTEVSPGPAGSDASASGQLDAAAAVAPDATETPVPSPTKDPDAAPPEPATAPHRGPCKVTWSDGRNLAFDYSDEGGSVDVDVDGDGKRDICGTFKATDGRPTYFRVDDGCDRKGDGSLRLEYEEGSQLASGTMTRGKETTPMTVIPIPSFGGVVPGYTLPARQRDLKVEEEDGKILSVTVKKGAGRPARKVSFSYDDRGRVSGITEDVGVDGSAEMQFSYVYDAAGNVESIRTVADGNETTATLGYGCWK